MHFWAAGAAADRGSWQQPHSLAHTYTLCQQRLPALAGCRCCPILPLLLRFAVDAATSFDCCCPVPFAAGAACCCCCCPLLPTAAPPPPPPACPLQEDLAWRQQLSEVTGPVDQDGVPPLDRQVISVREREKRGGRGGAGAARRLHLSLGVVAVKLQRSPCRERRPLALPPSPECTTPPHTHCMPASSLWFVSEGVRGSRGTAVPVACSCC